MSLLSKSQSFISQVLGVADELVTNAVFNAPFVNESNTQPGANREDSSVKMTYNKEARFFMANNTDRVLIGCIDPYGSLNLNHLRRLQ